METMVQNISLKRKKKKNKPQMYSSKNMQSMFNILRIK